MRRTAKIVEHNVGEAQLGLITSPELDVRCDLGLTLPYIKGPEDIEVVLRHPHLISSSAPLEMNGFGIRRTLSRSAVLEEEMARSGQPEAYRTLARDHPILVSFPPEVLWLAREGGLKALRQGLDWVLPGIGHGLDSREIKAIAETLLHLAQQGSRSFRFWRSIAATTMANERLSRLLIHATTAMAQRARARYSSGLVPLVDRSTPGSTTLSHRFNLAYATVVDALIEEWGSRRVPGYFYTIDLNSTVIQPDEWTEQLREVVGNARAALLQTPYFDGVLLAIRNLRPVSMAQGRVNVVYRLLRELRDICDEAAVPLWWSRPGIAGLGALDTGLNYASFRLNLGIDDVYMEGGPPELPPKFGKVLNSVKKQYWTLKQVQKAIKGPDAGLPDIGLARNRPTVAELENPRDFRIGFSKPYNLAVFRHLGSQWGSDTRQGETQAGKSYLQDFEAPFSAWGAI